MSSILKPPTCTTSQRVANILESGELVFDVDEQAFYTGDGTTAGGAMVFPANNYSYVAYASNASGADFSLTPSPQLPYRSEIHSIKPISNLTVANFSSWIRYLGNYVYTAYAKDSSGTGFSTVASSDLKNRADIHSEIPIYDLQASNFSSATWVKYIGDWSNIYIAYASDKNGSNFSTTQSDALPYRAILNTYTVKDNLTLADFEGCTWEKYVGNYVYVAYASNNSGEGFSTTPSNDLKFRAEINTEFKKDTLTLSDFSNAVWVKYIGNDGQGVTIQGEYNDSSSYAINDLVRYGNSQWVCISETTGNPPPSTSSTTSNTYWSLYLSDGNDGTGINFTGEYQSSQTYNVNDGVRYGDAQWICISDAAAGDMPPESSTEGSNEHWSLWIVDGKGFDIPANVYENDSSISNPTGDAITPYFRLNSLGDPEMVAKDSNGEIFTLSNYPIIPAICVYVNEENGTCAAVPVDVDSTGKSTASKIGVKTDLLYTWQTPVWTYNKIQVFICPPNSSAVTTYTMTTGTAGDGTDEFVLDTSYVWTASNGYKIQYSSGNSRWELLSNENEVLDYTSDSDPINVSWNSLTVMSAIE